MKYTVFCFVFFFFRLAQGECIKDIFSGFIENKGQVIDQNGISQPGVKFIFQQNDLNVILKENSFSYLQYRINEKFIFPESASVIKSFSQTDVFLHRIDIHFVGANPKPVILKENKLSHFFNYHNTYPSINQTSSFAKVTYKNLYKNIDLVFYSKNGNVKYDFILHPGAVLKDIQMVYEGSKNTSLQLDGSIHIKTTEGTLNEKIPISYLLNDLKNVRVTYQIKNNIVSFKSADYDKKQTLIIDPYPTISWNSIFENVNYYLSTTIDTHNNKILSAFCFANNIATTGAYQTTLQGGVDALVAKFDPNGILQWATYYGGQELDHPYSICSDNSDNIILTGITKSLSKISTSGSYQSVFGGGFDTFIAKFDTYGILTWGTYYGGNTGDTPYSVCTDLNNNVLIIGQRSSTNFNFSTPGAFQSTPGLTFLAKFSSSGSRIWGTYYGGPLTNGYKIVCGANNSIHISGETADMNLATPATHQLQPAGNYDAFITKFSSAGNRIWSTYFGGQGNEKMSYNNCLAIDNEGKVVISGSTNSTNQIATASAYKKIISGNDAFIAKFDDTGILNWSTYIGGENDDFGSSICVDDQNNIIVSGSTNSKTNISTACVFQPDINTSNNNAPSSNSNIFITKFDALGNIVWGSYYGDNAFGQSSVRMDQSNKIILTGFIRTSSKNNTVVEPTVSFPFSGNAFITSFNEAPIPITTISITGKNPFCQGDSIILKSTPGEKYLWSTGETTESIFAIHEGKYFLTMSDDNDCSISSDTVDLYYIRPSIILNGPPKFCTGNQIELTSSAGLSYKWSTQETTHSITINHSGNYFVTVTDTSNACVSTSNVLYVEEVSPTVISFKSKHDTICMGEKIEKILSVSDVSFLWSTGSTNDRIVVSSAGEYWVEVTKPPCPAVKDSFDLVIIPGIYYKIPNLITPNNDNKNDSFEIINILPNTSLSIYNSWGSMVYRDNNYQNNWDAKDLTDGVFYYFISNPSICVKDYSGWIEILK